jgi:hypothetical protein
MVAMELVKVPSVLFLDEATSGLDAFNASVLVECMRDLALRRRTAIIMTIHQPRSNIFYSFDRLTLLNKGSTVYHGLTRPVATFFESIGRPIPHDYNPADFLIDALFSAPEEGSTVWSKAPPKSIAMPVSADVREEVKQPFGDAKDADIDDNDDKVVGQDLEARSEVTNDVEKGDGRAEPATPGRIEVSFSRVLSINGLEEDGPLPSAFRESIFFKAAEADVQAVVELARAEEQAGQQQPSKPAMDGGSRAALGRLCRRVWGAAARWTKEVAVLSKRALANLYRNPMLLLSHLLAAAYFAGDTPQPILWLIPS